MTPNRIHLNLTQQKPIYIRSPHGYHDGNNHGVINELA